MGWGGRRGLSYRRRRRRTGCGRGWRGPGQEEVTRAGRGQIWRPGGGLFSSWRRCWRRWATSGASQHSSEREFTGIRRSIIQLINKSIDQQNHDGDDFLSPHEEQQSISEEGRPPFIFEHTFTNIHIDSSKQKRTKTFSFFSLCWVLFYALTLKINWDEKKL